MDRIAAIWFCIGALSVTFIFQGEIGWLIENNQYTTQAPIAEAIYSIPPTPAYAGMVLNDTQDTLGMELGSNASSAKLFIISDGSIEMNYGIGGKP